ncbi:MAG: GTPase [Desulfurococcales archaeon ex4484_58]|nr:MAG: GTPase [Desulfurococcales archaeon ex4484_58]
MPYFIVVMGTAGSGKTTLTYSLVNYLLDNQLDAIAVNLDPAVEKLPYRPDVDVREYVDARELMEIQGLGPNGALLAAVDMLALKIEELREEIWSIKANYIVIDTPGQMEIFAFRESGPIVINALVGDAKAVSLFLIDSIQASKPSNYFSALLLAASTQVRMALPQINVLTKIDLVSRDLVEEIVSYHDDPSLLATKIVSDRKASLIWGEEDVLVLVEKLLNMDIVPVSSIDMTGYDNLYAYIQRVVAGGEDYYTEEPSPRL